MNINFVLQLKKNNRLTAIAIAVQESSNLYHYFDDFNRDGCEVMVVHYVKNRKRALELANAWNKGFVANGNAWTKSEYAD